MLTGGYICAYIAVTLNNLEPEMVEQVNPIFLLCIIVPSCLTIGTLMNWDRIKELYFKKES